MVPVEAGVLSLSSGSGSDWGPPPRESLDCCQESTSRDFVAMYPKRPPWVAGAAVVITAQDQVPNRQSASSSLRRSLPMRLRGTGDDDDHIRDPDSQTPARMGRFVSIRRNEAVLQVRPNLVFLRRPPSVARGVS